jgi:hypothetical protein
METVDDLIENGRRLQLAGQLDDAERNYRAALDAGPANDQAWHMLGLAVLARGQAESAAGLMRRAIAAAPGGRLHHDGLGEALHRLGRDAEAAGCFACGHTLLPQELRMPAALLPGYSMNGQIPVLDWVFEISGADAPLAWTDQDFRSCQDALEAVLAGEAGARYSSDVHLQGLFARHAVTGRSVAVVGSERPYYEAAVLRFGGFPTTIEYRPIRHAIPGLTTLTVDQVMAGALRFDCAMSISSIEHSGLGRYGDPLDPDGDFKTMTLLKGLVKPGGLLFLQVPIGRDTVVWNAHRIYGRIRLPQLVKGWQLIDGLGFAMELFDRGGYQAGLTLHGSHASYAEPILVLRNA